MCALVVKGIEERSEEGEGMNWRESKGK